MNTQIQEEACDWFIRNRERNLSARDKADFDGWLRTSPQHVDAYLRMSSAWEDVGALGSGWEESEDDLIARARADAPVIALADLRDTAADGAHSSTPAQRVARAGWKIVAVAASTLIAVIGVLLFTQMNGDT